MRSPRQACVTPQLVPQAWCVSLPDGHGASPLRIFPLQDRKQLRVVLRLEGAPCFPQVPPPGPCQPLPPPSLSHPAPSFYLQVRIETRENNFSPPRPLQLGCGVVLSPPMLCWLPCVFFTLWIILAFFRTSYLNPKRHLGGED